MHRAIRNARSSTPSDVLLCVCSAYILLRPREKPLRCICGHHPFTYYYDTRNGLCRSRIIICAYVKYHVSHFRRKVIADRAHAYVYAKCIPFKNLVSVRESCQKRNK